MTLGVTNNRALSIPPYWASFSLTHHHHLKGNTMPKKRKVGRPRTSNLIGFSVKLPSRLVDVLDRAAGNSWDSRNMVIRRILEQYSLAN